jgi:hypothetical protein
VNGGPEKKSGVQPDAQLLPGADQVKLLVEAGTVCLWLIAKFGLEAKKYAGQLGTTGTSSPAFCTFSASTLQ